MEGKEARNYTVYKFMEAVWKRTPDDHRQQFFEPPHPLAPSPTLLN